MSEQHDNDQDQEPERLDRPNQQVVQGDNTRTDDTETETVTETTETTTEQTTETSETE